ncbi:DUF3152 domain-containing protein [Aeromicrobium sp. Marseille-Q0843]|uniref:DUF3152 domain-containing protein n=2 Tax=Aeromicrobium phoceense TaxID=2754045 RepID=A0A838XQG0_9ACTN|nr:DUF3152 domain-containing protein [Aeromicrobium phoceense]MBA4609100.1 DUF3152 domain-containing protein [Aeromicrobium phoceense]
MSEVVGLLLLSGAAVSAWRATHRTQASLLLPGRRDAARRRRPRPGARRKVRRRSGRWLSLSTVLFLAGAIVLGNAVDGLGAKDATRASETAGAAQPRPAATTPTPGRGSAETDAPASRTSRDGDRTPGAAPPIPESGSGRFSVAGVEPATPDGSGGELTYSVEVEEGVPYSANDVARFVDDVLSDGRGWTSVTTEKFRRVAKGSMLRIRLATPTTTDQLCRPLDTGGRLSCRNGEMVVLNAWRWAHGAEAYGSDLVRYRTYLVNHEFGHALGNGHDSCPGVGETSPVMSQQTKGLDGCLANPWPTAADGK